MKTCGLLSLVAVAVCLAVRAHGAPGEYETLTSPSGKFVAKAGIAGAEASPSVRFRVRLVFETSTKKPEGEIWTGLKNRWAVTWSTDDVFLACGINEEAPGNPMEFYAFDFVMKGDGRRSPTGTERGKVLAEYQRKYPNEGKEAKRTEPTANHPSFSAHDSRTF